MLAADDTTWRLRAEVESEIERYLAERRAGVTGFVNRHFSAHAVAVAHGKTLRHDIIRHPLNLTLALPSLVLSRARYLCERFEWKRAQHILEHVPLPFNTAYERRIDVQMVEELFAIPDLAGPLPSPLTQAVLRNPVIAEAIAADPAALGFLRNDAWLVAELQKGVKEWNAARAQLSDAAGSGAVLAASYLLFRSSGHGMLEMGRKLAGDRARSQAAEHFFLGERVGSLFYSIAPPHPTTGQVVFATVVMFAFVGLLTVAVNLLSDPVQRQLGIQHKQLLHIIDALEERLLSTLRKRLRGAGPAPTPMPFLPGERVAQLSAQAKHLSDQVTQLSGHAVDAAGLAAAYARQGTVKALARVLAALTVWKNRYVARVGTSFARKSAVAALLLALLGGYALHRATRFDPYEEAYDLVARGAYPTALARLDWLNKNPGYREQPYYWFLRGRAHCGMGNGDACCDAYARVLQKDLSYREDEHVIGDLVALVRDQDHARAKKLLLQEVGPEAITALKNALPKAADRFEVVAMLEQLGAKNDIPYDKVARLELDAASSCEDKRFVLERMISDGWRAANDALKPLQDAKKWRCLQPVLKQRLSR